MGVVIQTPPRRVNDRGLDTERLVSMLFQSTLPLRFWAKLYADPSGCWLWQGGLTADGYGKFYPTTPGRVVLISSHRAAYLDFVGPIPSGLTIDHLCRTRHCANPRHMEVVTRRENQRRGLKGTLTTHCPQGHPYDAANTHTYNSHRYCRACNRLQQQRRWRERLL
jgi:hypothetical protein